MIKWDLLREALAIVDGVPDERLWMGAINHNLYAWQNSNVPTDCGTVGCAIGWISMHPKFNALGLTSDNMGRLMLDGNLCTFVAAAEKVFGLPKADALRLFEPLTAEEENLGLRCDKQAFRIRVVDFFTGYGHPCKWEVA